ncbi:hypothetical protein IU500_15905 [Nocardia terpenica]|uniref:hypothetical protein n=1 Tax=Nocardia terpenica TaxID=455432 RepID=UPI0018958D4A|nr:hypothetical protein [Nocardia terpenica]MBF6061244.1 hypothetical protein [Nocardia terpenica]MBF6105527.1 hypothetical protein [Nocardia terpenica]MBF6113003.1 hypothetical protein [Nocardia terpenica]MBF6119133.1 hypothetical protein [Nocardia terpenica]MBF6152781.1 hypothetical protein [Nocardia terpenica]
MRTPYSTTTAPARFLLLGDSHAGPIGKAAQAARIPFRGGPIGAAREFTDDFFTARADDVVFSDAETEQYYRKFLDELGISTIAELTVPLVVTFGFAAHFVATRENWEPYRVRGNGFEDGFLDSSLFEAIVTTVVRDALAFYGHVRGLGLRVLAVLPPQRVPGQSDPEVFLAAQDCVRRALLGLDIEIVDLRERITDASGFQRPDLREVDDEIHGNLAWGRIVLADLLDRGL